MSDTHLEYPRCLHKPGGAVCIVQNDTERDAKLAEGWQTAEGLFHPPAAAEAAPDSRLPTPDPPAEKPSSAVSTDLPPAPIEAAPEPPAANASPVETVIVPPKAAKAPKAPKPPKAPRKPKA